MKLASAAFVAVTVAEPTAIQVASPDAALTVSALGLELWYVIAPVPPPPLARFVTVAPMVSCQRSRLRERNRLRLNLHVDGVRRLRLAERRVRSFRRCHRRGACRDTRRNSRRGIDGKHAGIGALVCNRSSAAAAARKIRHRRADRDCERSPLRERNRLRHGRRWWWRRVLAATASTAACGGCQRQDDDSELRPDCAPIHRRPPGNVPAASAHCGAVRCEACVARRVAERAVGDRRCLT